MNKIPTLITDIKNKAVSYTIVTAILIGLLGPTVFMLIFYVGMGLLLIKLLVIVGQYLMENKR